MAAYATPAQLKSYVGKDRLSNFLPSTADPDLTELLNAAAGDLDRRLSRRYNVPIVTTALAAEDKTRMDALLAKWTSIIAVWMGGGLAGRDLPKGFEKLYKDLSTFLDQVALGTQRLPFLDGKDWPKIKVVGSTADGLVEIAPNHALFETSRAF